MRAMRQPIADFSPAWVQDMLIAVHEKRHTYDPGRPFVAWLAAIARYKWIDALRSLKAKPTEALDDELPVPGDEESLTSASLLERLLKTLKPAQSRVIRLDEGALLALKERFRDRMVVRVSLDHYSKAVHELERGPRTCATASGAGGR
jgi:hypothetical protein